MTRIFHACKDRVHNRGVAPDSFLNALLDWAVTAPDEVFAPNPLHDIYSNVVTELGPWTGLSHRKAAMLEVLRVLGGFESSWKWNAGRDITNPTSNTPCTEEAGIFQCSGNAMEVDSSLRKLLKQAAGEATCRIFIPTSKTNHPFALEFCARLLRFTVNHHGPVKHKHINPWLRRDAVGEFQQFLGGS